MAGACGFDGCGRPVFCKGLCGAHYRQRLAGKPLTEIGSSRKGPPPVDLSGQRFGGLTAQTPVPAPEGRAYLGRHWRCACDCGGVIVLAAGQLRAGRRKTCGACAPPKRSDSTPWVDRDFRFRVDEDLEDILRRLG